MSQPRPRPLNRWDVAKIIGLLLMFVDHAGYFFYPDEMWLRAIGRAAAPIFLFLTGFASHYHFRMDIFILALLITASDFLVSGGPNTLNILFTILAVRLIFAWLERRGRIIERPLEWYVGAMAMLISLALLQYGSFAILFGVSGYMMRREALYSPRMRYGFLLLSVVTYGIVEGALFQFDPADWLLMSLCLIVLAFALATLHTRPVSKQYLPQPVAAGAKLMSRYSAHIYAFHLIALGWITGMPL